MGLTPGQRGFTLIELVIVFGLLSFLLAIGIVHFRNSRASASMLTSNIVSHMDFRRASTRLQEELQAGCEILKPFEGRTLPYLVFRDIVNRTRILYLEKASDQKEKPARLVSYTDCYKSAFDPAMKETLFGRIKKIEFTTISLGIVVVHLSLVDAEDRELSSIFEIPLKNFGATEVE